MQCVPEKKGPPKKMNMVLYKDILNKVLLFTHILSTFLIVTVNKNRNDFNLSFDDVTLNVNLDAGPFFFSNIFCCMVHSLCSKQSPKVVKLVLH